MNRNEIVADIDLINAVQDAMKRRGLFSKLKAQVRAEVYHILEDKSVVMPEKPHDIFVVSELVKEFLSLLGLKNTLSVFCEEMGQPKEMAVDRGVIGAELGLNTLGTEPSVPLLMMIIEHLKRSRMDYIAHDEVSVQAEPNDTSDEEDEISKKQRDQEYKLFLQEQKMKEQQEQLQRQQMLLQQRENEILATESRLFQRQQQQVAEDSHRQTFSHHSEVKSSPKSTDSVTQQGMQITTTRNIAISNPSGAVSDNIFTLMNKNRVNDEEDYDEPAYDEDSNGYGEDRFDD